MMPTPSDYRPSLLRTLWPAAALTGGVAVLLTAHLLWLDPYELAADEAHYWEWSRRLDWSYYSKGPGVAWTIAASTALLGDKVWAIRLPAVLALCVGMLATAATAARLTLDHRGSTRAASRAGLLAAALWALTPAYFAVGHFMTIDAPMLACWSLATLAIVCWWQRTAAGEQALTMSILIGLAVGIGALFKYTTMLVLPGMLLATLLAGRGRAPARHPRLAGFFAAALIAGLALTPVLIWNLQRGWPTVAHLMGHLGAPGGDVHREAGAIVQPLWTLEYLLGQVGVIGPPVIALIVFSGRSLWQRRQRRQRDKRRWEQARLLLCLSLPVWMLYLAISLVTDVEANWALGAYVPLLLLPAIALPAQLRRYRRLVHAWRRTSDRPWRGVLRRKPETLPQVAWHWALGVGLVAGVAVLFAPWLRALPGGEQVPGLDRVHGHRDWATAVAKASAGAATGDPGLLLIADHYGKASLLAFYLPGQPRVYSAAHALGSRRSSYDYFADTDLHARDILGRDAILIGGSVQRWSAALVFSRIEVIDASQQVYLARRYAGTRQTEFLLASNP